MSARARNANYRVEADNVPHLLDEQRVVGDLVRFRIGQCPAGSGRGSSYSCHAAQYITPGTLLNAFSDTGCQGTYDSRARVPSFISSRDPGLDHSARRGQLHSQLDARAPAQAQDGVEESTYDRIWRRFTEWYVDDSNPVIQKVLFSGRFQHEFAAIDADEGDHREWNVRRMRLGSRVTLFRTFTLHGEVELNPQEADPLYVRFTDLYVQWSRSRHFALTLGKHRVPFTMDGSTSSQELITIDRNNLTNNIWFTDEYIPGVSVSGTVAPWTYRAGVYSGGEANREFGRFNGSVFALGVLGYDFAQSLGVNEALLTGNYCTKIPMHATPSLNGSSTSCLSISSSTPVNGACERMSRLVPGICDRTTSRA